MSIKFTEAAKKDLPFLRDMLYEAIFVAEGEDPYPRKILDLPAISKYIDNWKKEGDIGILAYLNNIAIGAIWGRIFSNENKGYGFVAENIPEMSMAIKSEYRNQGIGTELLVNFFKIAKHAGYNAISLSVDQKNPAVRLYKKMGFKIVDKPGSDYTMLKEIHLY
ncbi:MAG: GNAT family N-acetyltransferase [Mariniphaga sp.]|nr:GNAT family N-acetyltransferase [Mariniphaga sp.]